MTIIMTIRILAIRTLTIRTWAKEIFTKKEQQKSSNA
jgi:hypothetical protein